METRPYFVFGDWLANVLVATLAVAITTRFLAGTWGMLPGMLVGMLVGMIVALVVSMLLVPVLGIMETMMACMLSGMLGGMCGGMWGFDAGDVLRWGIGLGSIVFILIYTLNFTMSGQQPVDS